MNSWSLQVKKQVPHPLSTPSFLEPKPKDRVGILNVQNVTFSSIQVNVMEQSEISWMEVLIWNKAKEEEDSNMKLQLCPSNHKKGWS
jgi:hypothetical protein